MKNVPVLNYQDFIGAEGDELYTTSLQIAAAFGKRHTHVLRAIRAVLAELPPAEHQPTFGPMLLPVDIGNGATRNEPAYRVTRDGFALLAMGFTGKKALMFKVAYIKAFNAMAAHLKNQREGLRFQCMQVALEMKDSERRGSFHGRGLNERKREKPVLERRYATLLEQAQPSLLPN